MATPAQRGGASADPTILFVGAASRVTPAAEMARETRAAIDIGAVSAGALARADVVIFDIDVADAVARETLRATIGRLKRRPLFVFAVDRGAHLPDQRLAGS